MASEKVKKAAKHFLKEYELREVNCATLSDIIERLGYTVVEFNSSYNDENVTLVINTLGLAKQISESRGFTYKSGDFRLVFVNVGLSEKEKTVVFAHELGHIVLEHMDGGALIGKDVREEYEANEFAHYILHEGTDTKLSLFIKKHRKILIIAAAAFFAIAVTLVTCKIVSVHNSYHGTYYVTATGTKYHRKDCYYIEGKKDTRRLTEEDFNSGKYTPCSKCLPDE